MLNWKKPLRQTGKVSDFDGRRVSGPKVYLRAMIDEVSGDVVNLSAGKMSLSSIAHFKNAGKQGVRFMVTRENDSSTPIYYRPDGRPWLDHHLPLENTDGPEVSFEDMAEAQREKERKQNILREQQRKAWAERAERDRLTAAEKKRADELAAAEAELIAAEKQEAEEAHPLWGTF